MNVIPSILFFLRSDGKGIILQGLLIYISPRVSGVINWLWLVDPFLIKPINVNQEKLHPQH